MCVIVCRCPHWHRSDWAMPQRWRLARQVPWPVRNWFRIHGWRGRSKPGGRTAGSGTRPWLTTEADTQASLHRLSVTPVVSTDHMGRRDLSLAEQWKTITHGHWCVSEWYIRNDTSAQLGYTVAFTLVHAGKYRTEDRLKIQKTLKLKHYKQKANNAKNSKTKLPWFSRFLRHSARKRGGLIR